MAFAREILGGRRWRSRSRVAAPTPPRSRPRPYETATNGSSTAPRSSVTNGSLALKESDGLVVVWATVDKTSGRAGIKPFVVEAHRPGVEVAKLEAKMGIRVSDTAELVFEDCRIPSDNVLGDPAVKQATSGTYRGAMATFDATRPIVAAQSVGVAARLSSF